MIRYAVPLCLAVGSSLLVVDTASALNCVPVANGGFVLNGEIGGPVVIKQNLVEGDLIRSYTYPGNDRRLYRDCVGDSAAAGTILPFFQPSAFDPTVVKTGMEGVGMRLTWSPPTGEGGGDKLFPFTHTYKAPSPGARYDIFHSGTWRLDFIRIEGDFTGGILFDGRETRYGEMRVDGEIGATYRLKSVDFRLATCAVSASSLNQEVGLGRHTARDFDGAGNGRWQQFEFVSENCDLAHFSNARFKFTHSAGLPSPGGFPGLFPLDAQAEPADGVGVQLQSLNAGDVEPGVEMAMPAVAAGGKYDFQARYVKTGELKGGNAKSTIQVRIEFD